MNRVLEYRTSLSPDDALARIRSAVIQRGEKPPSYSAVWSGDDGKVFVGRIQGDRFTVWRIPRMRNLWAPVLTGRVIAAEGGSVVRAGIRINRAGQICSVLWAAFLSGYGVLTLRNDLEAGRISQVYGAFGMAAAMAFIGGLGIVFGLMDREDLRELLERLFPDRTS